MESLFFNIGDKRYKTTTLLENGKERITRVDISNGIVFFDIFLDGTESCSFKIENLDRMVVIAVVKEGGFTISDNIDGKKFVCRKDEVYLFCSSRQDFTLAIDSERSDIFVLSIADFFLKRYLSLDRGEPIDFLYEKIQGDAGVELVDRKPLDALSMYIVGKIIDTKNQSRMRSIKCEHNVIELMIHIFSLICMVESDIDQDELQIALKAQKYLLNNFVNPPAIPDLAHICATNETKLKRAFKRVFKTTIGGYVRKLRLEKANLLLKESTLSIGEVAKEVGYLHQGYFGRLFFKTYGIYPKDLK